MSSFIVKSGRILVTDPCYTPPAKDGLLYELPATNGRWHGRVEFDKDEPDRVSSLIAFCGGHHREWEKIGFAGVDSGQMGVFDRESFGDAGLGDYGSDDDGTPSRYRQICNMTLVVDIACIRNLGFASSSGWGDGSYPVYVKRNDMDEVVAVRVDFMSDEEEEYDDEEN